MRLRLGVGVLVIAAGGVSLASPAAATPGQGQGLVPATANCNVGTITVVSPRSSNPVGFINGQVYLVDSVTVTAPDNTVVFSKDYGQRTGIPSGIICTAPSGGTTVTLVVSGPVGS